MTRDHCSLSCEGSVTWEREDLLLAEKANVMLSFYTFKHVNETNNYKLLKLFHPVALLYVIPPSLPVSLKSLKSDTVGFPGNGNTNNSNQFISTHHIISEVKFLTEQSDSLCF